MCLAQYKGGISFLKLEIWKIQVISFFLFLTFSKQTNKACIFHFMGPNNNVWAKELTMTL